MNLEDLDLEEFEIIIPYTVIEEIDNLKIISTHNKGYLARKQLQKLYLQINKVKILEDKKDGLIERFGRVDKQDNVILNTVINLNKETPTILYTNDIQLIIKQKIFSVPIFTDIEKIDVSTITTNVKTIKVDDNLMNEILKEGQVENVLNLPYGYYILTDSSGENREQAKVKNEKIIEHIPLIDKKKYKRNSKFDMKLLFPKSVEQQIFLDQIYDENIKLITSQSSSGTGKTLLQLYGQIRMIEERPELYKKIVFIVNPSPTNGKEIGFLKGDQHEKTLPYMAGIIDNLGYLFGEEIPECFDLTKTDKSDFFEIRPLQFLRGSSISHSIVIVDEVQNLTLSDIKTVVTRIQNNSKLILIGDIQQIDERIQVDYTGIVRFINYLTKQKDKLSSYWVNITMKEKIRNEFLNILDEFFNEID